MKTKNKCLLLLSVAALSSCGASSLSSIVSGSTGDSSSSISESLPSIESSDTGAGSTDSSKTSDSAISSSSSSSSKTSQSIEHLPAIDHIKIFCPTKYTHLYAWDSAKKEILGGWPGSASALTSYDANWKTYDFDKSISEINFIFNIGGKEQTGDLSAEEIGYYWFYQDGLIQQDFDPAIYGDGESSDIPQGNYEVVNSAADYRNLPAMKNFASNSVVNAYKGNRTDFRDESIYFVMTTRFYNGDKSNDAHCWDGVSKGLNTNDPEWRGDFKGLIEKMDYIKALGFTAIWITPVVKNASGYDYHGYHAINFKEVDPRYESQDVKFQDVINAAHQRDMKIVLDVVFNHSGNFGEENLFPMFKYHSDTDTTIAGMERNAESGILPKSYDSLAGEAQYGKRIDAMKNDSSDKFHIYHHEKSFGYEQYIEQTGQMAGDCVDLNTENPTVANYLVDAYGKFIQMGVDAFRIDTMKHISRYSLNKYYFPAFASIAKTVGNPYFHMFGEVCSRWSESVWNHNNPNCSAPFYSWGENKDYPWGDRVTNEATTKTFYEANNSVESQPSSNNAKLNNGLTYHSPDKSRWNNNSVIDFQMHWNFENARNAYGMGTGWDHTYQDATYNVVYVDSHDYGPQNQEKTRYEGGTDAWKDNMSLMFTFRGVPCVYYGSEIEFKRGAVIDVGPNANLEDTGRAYFGDNIEGTVTPTGFGTYNNASGKMATTLNGTLSKHLQKLSQARLNCIALRRGQYSTSNSSGNSINFVRRYTANGVDSIAAVAIDGAASFNGLPNGTYRDLYNGGTVNVSNGTLSCNASNHGVCIFVKQ